MQWPSAAKEDKEDAHAGAEADHHNRKAAAAPAAATQTPRAEEARASSSDAATNTEGARRSPACRELHMSPRCHLWQLAMHQAPVSPAQRHGILLRLVDLNGLADNGYLEFVVRCARIEG